MNNSFEIRTKKEDIPAKAIMLIKQKTNQSLACIKEIVAVGTPFFGCELSDDKNLALIIELSTSLFEAGIETETLYNSRVEDLSVLQNVLESHRQTALQLELSRNNAK